MDFQQLFDAYPGLQNYYENAIANGYTGTPQELYTKFVSETTGRMPTSNVMEYNNALANGYSGTMSDYVNSQRANAGMETLLNAISPEKLAYQRSLLSGTTQPNKSYGLGLAGSPYYGYSRNPFAGLLY